MSKSYDNKMMSTKTEAVERDYLFPEVGIVVKASSLEEAEEKKQTIINQNKK